MIGEKVSQYRIVEMLGVGGMGEVYRARDSVLGRHVALKRPKSTFGRDPVLRRRIVSEARAASKLLHPNITTVFEVIDDGDVPWLVMEYVDGCSLRHLLNQRETLPIEDVLKHAEGLADGLRLAHKRGVLHRDVNPNNILIGSDGRARLTDFGLAKAFAVPATTEDVSTETLAEPTEPSRALGTRGYMAPEQALGRPMDPRSDIFSLGLVIYEMCTGLQAFGPSDSDWLDRLLHRDPAPITSVSSQTPKELERIVRKAIAKRPDERYQTAGEMVVDLRALRRRMTSDSDVSDIGPLPKKAGPPRIALIGAALAVIAAVAWVVGRSTPATNPFDGWASRQLTTAPGWERQPAISPSGEFVAYAANTFGSSDIWLVGAHGGQPHRLTEGPGDETGPAWYPDGSAIAFESRFEGEPSIWKVAVLGGPPVPVLADAVDPAISPDGTRIAFATKTESGMYRIAVAMLAEPNRYTVLTGDSDGIWNHRQPAWSPDARTLSYSDSKDLWLVDAAGGPGRRLTVQHAIDSQPTWTGDGRWILFTSKRGGSFALWRIAPNKGEAQHITFGTGPEQDPSIDTAGRRLVYSTWTRHRDVVLVDLSVGEPIRLPSASIESAPVLAPDSTAVAFVSDRRGAFDLWIQDLANGRPVGAPRRLTDHSGSVATPQFSNDGRWLVYHRVVPGDLVQRDIWMVPAAGGTPVQITDHPANDTNPVFAPDDSHLAFVSDRSGRDQIWIAELVSTRPDGQPVQLTDGAQPASLPDWSPDGRNLAYVRNDEVWMAPADGNGEAQALTNGAGAYMARWLSSGEALMVSGTWDEASTHLRTLAVETGVAAKTDPEIVFGDVTAPGLFDISLDGRTVAFIETVSAGDLWIMEAGNS